MTEKTLETRNIVVKIEQRENIKNEETQSIQIWIIDKETKEVLQSFTVLDSNDMGKAWIADKSKIYLFNI